MKKVAIGLFLAVSFVIEMFVGAVQLHLFTSPNAGRVSFFAVVIFGSIVIFGVTTWISDIFVMKIFKWNAKEDGRWSYYSCGDFNKALRVGLRVTAHALSQFYPIYFAALYIFK